ncbi:hypothetical protein NMD33_08525 [Escherichia coli]|uniref:hypothetical protein n=1 Tax=Escherichia coli TaxID=562 RepID=UPI00287B0ADC|nr:hypothetical protein [Escherichia coli]MDS1558853.1 hypothetical protein [Escherichia coli]BEB95454.1 hypothetical protein VEE20_16040 [Escherichia coli]BED15616.1 hypothetical protein VEE71_43390 [Escherichia coli]
MVEIATREDSHKKHKKTACNALCDVLRLSGYHSSPTLFESLYGLPVRSGDVWRTSGTYPNPKNP